MGGREEEVEAAPAGHVAVVGQSLVLQGPSHPEAVVALVLVRLLLVRAHRLLPPAVVVPPVPPVRAHLVLLAVVVLAVLAGEAVPLHLPSRQSL